MPDEPGDPVVVNPQTGSNPPIQCTPNAITPPAFQYDASVNFNIGGATDTLYPNAAISDFGPVIRDKVYALYWKGTGTLYIAPGRYPVISGTTVTFYPTDGIKKLSIVGIPDASGNLPTLFDTEVSRLPHSILDFSSTPNDNIEFYVSALEIIGNNIPVSGSHPFLGRTDIGGKGIFLGSMNKIGIANVKIRNFYGEAIQIYNWADNFMTDYNIGESCTVINSYLTDNWAANSHSNSGDGIMFYHVNQPRVINTVISNNYTQQASYGRGGIVIEAGTKNAIVQNSFIQGYRVAVILERDFGGHQFLSNKFFNNQHSGLSFAHDINEVRVLGAGAYKPTKVLNNIFEHHQTYGQYGANLWSFIAMADFGYALAGMEIKNNTFVAHEKQSPRDKDSWWTLGNEYNFFIKTDGQQGLDISGNSYNSPGS